VCVIFAYFISSLDGIAIVKFLNYHFCFTSWLLFALLSRSTWVLSIPLHVGLQALEGMKIGVSFKQLRLYFFIAVGLSLVELLNSLSMSILPGSWYALLKGSDVGFSMALSHLILGKKYKSGQVVAVVFVMGGIGMVVLLGPPSAPAHHGSSSETEYVSRSVAAGICLGGVFMNAFCAVLTEATLKQTLEEEEKRLLEQQIINETHYPPSELLLSNAYSMWTTLFSFGILLVPVLWSGQLGHALVFVKYAACDVEQIIDNEDASQLGGGYPRLFFPF
jgi:hypothetical protein